MIDMGNQSQTDLKRNKVDILTLVATAITACATMLTVYFMYGAKEQLDKHQQTQIEVSFCERYSAVVTDWAKLKDKMHNLDTLSNEKNSIYYRFWEVQYDQFTQFKKGHINIETYNKWMYSRNIECYSDKHILHELIKEGWPYVDSMIYSKIDTPFESFIEKI